MMGKCRKCQGYCGLSLKVKPKGHPPLDPKYTEASALLTVCCTHPLTVLSSTYSFCLSLWWSPVTSTSAAKVPGSTRESEGSSASSSSPDMDSKDTLTPSMSKTLCRVYWREGQCNSAPPGLSFPHVKWEDIDLVWAQTLLCPSRCGPWASPFLALSLTLSPWVLRGKWEDINKRAHRSYIQRTTWRWFFQNFDSDSFSSLHIFGSTT